MTALATDPLLDAVRLHPGTHLLDVATGPGALAAEAANRGAHRIARAPAARLTPGLYRQLGRDPAAVIEEGKAALRERRGRRE